MVCDCCYCGECTAHAVDFSPVKGVFLFKVPKQCKNNLETLKEYVASVTTFAVQLPPILPPQEMESSTVTCSTLKEPPLAVDSPSAKENILSPLQTFHPFPRLPPELCFDIWDLAFAEQYPNITAIKKRNGGPIKYYATLPRTQRQRFSLSTMNTVL